MDEWARSPMAYREHDVRPIRGYGRPSECWCAAAFDCPCGCKKWSEGRPACCNCHLVESDSEDDAAQEAYDLLSDVGVQELNIEVEEIP